MGCSNRGEHGQGKLAPAQVGRKPDALQAEGHAGEGGGRGQQADAAVDADGRLPKHDVRHPALAALRVAQTLRRVLRPPADLRAR